MIVPNLLQVYVLYKWGDDDFSVLFAADFQYGQQFESALESVNWSDAARYERHFKIRKSAEFKVQTATISPKDALQIFAELKTPDPQWLEGVAVELAHALRAQAQMFRSVMVAGLDHPKVVFLLVSHQPVPDADSIHPAEREKAG